MENHTEKKLTIDLLKANIYSFKVMLYAIIIFGLPYYLLWQDQFTLTNLKETSISLNNRFSFFLGFIPILVLVIGIILHELIHGISFLPYCKNGLKSIKFGILKQYMTPYCHCKEPLQLKHYRVGVFMPAIILGFIPAIAAIIFGNFYLLCFGIFFTMAAAGDFMIWGILRKEDKENYVLDHPSEAGCYVYTPNDK